MRKLSSDIERKEPPIRREWIIRVSRNLEHLSLRGSHCERNNRGGGRQDVAMARRKGDPEKEGEAEGKVGTEREE